MNAVHHDDAAPQHPTSLFVQFGEKVLADQLYILQETEHIKQALRKVSSPFPFLRSEGILFLLGLLRDLADSSLEINLSAREDEGNVGQQQQVYHSISVAPLDTMTRIPHHRAPSESSTHFDPLRNKRWYLASDRILGSLNLISPIFHRVIARRDLMLALIGAGGGGGGGGGPTSASAAQSSPLEPTLPEEAALLWNPSLKPTALVELHQRLRQTTTAAMQQTGAAQSVTTSSNGANEASPRPLVTCTLLGDSTNGGASLVREVVASMIKGVGRLRPSTGDLSESYNAIGGGISLEAVGLEATQKEVNEPLPDNVCDALDACLRYVSAQLDSEEVVERSCGQQTQPRREGESGRSGGGATASQPSQTPPNKVTAESATSLPSTTVNDVLESAVRESIGKGYVLASLAFGSLGAPSHVGGDGGGRTSSSNTDPTGGLAGSTSLGELEAALRVIQGMCIFVPSQKSHISDSAFVPFVIETCSCCLQHVQRLSLLERRSRSASRNLADLLALYALETANEHQQQQHVAEVAKAGGTDDEGSGSPDKCLPQETSSSMPPHQPVLSMRLDSIATMCAMIDALEAACHYNPAVVNQLVQLGGVKCLLNLAGCPYTPPVIRCGILDMLSLLLQQAAPYRRAVLGQAAAAAASREEAADVGASSSSAARHSLSLGGDDRRPLVEVAVEAQQALSLELPPLVAPSFTGVSHAGLASVATDYPTLRAKGIPVPPTPAAAVLFQHRQLTSATVVGGTQPDDGHTAIIVGSASPRPSASSHQQPPEENYKMDRATASKLDSAVRTWLASHQMFGTTVNALLRLRDVSSGCGLSGLRPAASSRGGSNCSSSSPPAMLSAVVQVADSKDMVSDPMTTGFPLKPHTQQQRGTSTAFPNALPNTNDSSTEARRMAAATGRQLQREVTSLGAEREHAFQSLLEELNSKLICCVPV